MDPSTVKIIPDGPNKVATVTKRRRIRTRHISPEVGSLYDILHDHAGKSLYVIPLCWTDLHAQLLRCRFKQMPAWTTPTPNNTSTPRRQRKTPGSVVALGHDLDILLSTDGTKLVHAKNRAMRCVIAKFFPEHLARPSGISELDLRFGKSFFPRTVRCQLVWNQPSTLMSFDSATTWTASQSASNLLASMTVNVGSEDPMLAYVSRSHLEYVRGTCFRVLSGPNRSFNMPVHRLRKLRAKNLMPSNPDEDSYMIAVMVAMAQQSCYTDVRAGKGFAPRAVKARVLTVSEDDNAFIVYTATVPIGLLQMFHEPEKAPLESSQIEVEYAQVPIWPVLGLKERLGKALGADMVGDFSRVPLDTYEQEEEMESTPESITPKRRRDALSEVFNASFSEDRESDCPEGVFPKRQCFEETRIGVVR
ncbi:hypothetical protein GGR57DRAFT_264668 [Xylariaceae sp. FL1272]|nr:hypothetical protein GGR57DRAFT_264668 [Xylariaceae sp. FL1272]